MPVALRFLLALAAGAVGMVVAGILAAAFVFDAGMLRELAPVAVAAVVGAILASGVAWRALREPTAE